MQDTATGTSVSSHFRLLLFLSLTSGLVSCWARFHGDAAAPFDDSSLPCPQGCHCVETDGLVNCSNGQWTYIPAMPRFARRVLFENNRLHHIDNTSLSNLTVDDAEVLFLSLKGNNISSFTGNSFIQLNHLQFITLDRISNNMTVFQNIFKDLNTLANLTVLSLSGNRLCNNRTQHDFWQPLGNSNLSWLYLKHDIYRVYNHADFLPLRNLTHLNLEENYIQEVHLTVSDTLEQLVLDYNKIVYLPNFCYHEFGEHAYFKNLRYLALRGNLLSEISRSKLRCLSKLRVIDLSMNLLFNIHTNTFADLPNLEVIFLFSMRISFMRLSDHAFNNTNVQFIIIYNSRLDFQRDVHPSAFNGCTNLRVLDISLNLMRTFNADNFTQMFSHLSNLEVLRIISSRLMWLPFNNLTFFPNLSTIDISGNDIHFLDPQPFLQCNRLKTLNASRNRIQSLDETLKPAFDRLKHIDLALNSFDCDCRLLWFKEYLKANYTRFFYYNQGYKCVTPLDVQETYITSLPLSERTCMLPQDVALVIIVCCCVVILLTVAVALRWRYRWYLHFLLLVLERRHSRRRPGAFSHDYYVSADMDSGTDREWVLQQLMPRLTQFGLRACSAEDTTPGHPELSSALTAMMEQCQRVLFVVSNAYAQSGRCQFELTLALKASLELQRHDITVILLEPVASRYVSSALQVLVKEFACLPWPTDSADLATARDRFWETLRSALVPRDNTG